MLDFNVGLPLPELDLGLPLLALPLRVVLFQLLALLVVIAIEAMILEQKLDISPRGSVQFATIINLFSTLAGWLLFLVVEAILPARSRLETINYVFFNSFFTIEPQAIRTLVLVLMLVVYFVTFFLEAQALNVLLLVLSPQPQMRKDTNQITTARHTRYRAAWTDWFRMQTLLIANAWSYGAVLVLLFLRHILTPSP
jgi:hypothetical protein